MPKTLHGLKAIAQYLSEKTGLELSATWVKMRVFRNKLPVRRLPGRIVYQTSDALDEWLKQAEREAA